MIYYIKLMLGTLKFTRLLECEQICQQNLNKWGFIDKIHAIFDQDGDVTNPFDLVALASPAYTLHCVSLKMPMSGI